VLDVHRSGKRSWVHLDLHTTTRRQPSNWHTLQVHATDQFRTERTQPPSVPGSYVIVDLPGTPLYVGEAEDPDQRLNSSNGSLDNFNNSKRTSDPARNFVKHLVSTGMLDGLRVEVVEEVAVLTALGIDSRLTKLDRCKVEKLLGICRVGLVPAPASSGDVVIEPIPISPPGSSQACPRRLSPPFGF